MTYVPAVGHIVRSKRDNQTYRVTKVFAVRVHVMRLAWGKRMKNGQLGWPQRVPYSFLLSEITEATP